ncbi:MAG: phytanoyl-CoA dioxygenase family protein [Planctomycetia bacterium]|nr:phytanoyl-CoA dioxygenase family protein [Planctomycetia bacterium]
MSAFRISDELWRKYQEDGYFIAEKLFDDEEIRLLGSIARAEHQQKERGVSRRDGQGGTIKLTVENELADNIYSAIVRSPRIVDSMEKLLGGEVYHFHHKMILKEPLTGGAWEWHQDYGYWYNNACLYPYLASCMIAVDRATKENGCLQVIKGSHHIGRIDHNKVGDQTGADMERVQQALEHLELVHCELEPGSAIFFHCNLLHCSAQNKSTNPRWAFICCYNAARNNPFKESRHPRYSFLEKWPDSRVREIGQRDLARLKG